MMLFTNCRNAYNYRLHTEAQNNYIVLALIRDTP